MYKDQQITHYAAVNRKAKIIDHAKAINTAKALEAAKKEADRKE